MSSKSTLPTIFLRWAGTEIRKGFPKKANGGRGMEWYSFHTTDSPPQNWSTDSASPWEWAKFRQWADPLDPDSRTPCTVWKAQSPSPVIQPRESGMAPRWFGWRWWWPTLWGPMMYDQNINTAQKTLTLQDAPILPPPSHGITIWLCAELQRWHSQSGVENQPLCGSFGLGATVHLLCYLWPPVCSPLKILAPPGSTHIFKIIMVTLPLVRWICLQTKVCKYCKFHDKGAD